MNKLFFFPQVAEQTIYFPKFAEQSFFSQKNHSTPQESNGRPLIIIIASLLHKVPKENIEGMRRNFRNYDLDKFSKEQVTREIDIFYSTTLSSNSGVTFHPVSWQVFIINAL